MPLSVGQELPDSVRGEHCDSTKTILGLKSRAKVRIDFVTAGLIAFLCLISAHSSKAQTFGCSPSMANDIVCENSKAGETDWDIAGGGAGDLSIQGFATDISVGQGGTVNFKINTNATAYDITIFRMGYYGGAGARRIASISPSVLPQTQPACKVDATTNLYDCGNWAVSAFWQVPANATSGIYFAVLFRPDTGGASHIFFVVRNDSSHSDILYQTSDETWQAYNSYGGHSVYGGANTFDLTNRAFKVSYNRPFITRGFGSESATWVFGAEYPMVRWLEANGYDVTYSTGLDAARNGGLILNHKIYTDCGHDEYVSGPQRTNIEAARNAGVNLAFFSGNEFFWKTRWENSIDGTNTPYRTMVVYKETLGPPGSGGLGPSAKIDPNDPPTWTGTWRDPSFSPPADGGRPENALMGTIFMVNGPGTDNPGNLSIKVPAADGKMRFWRNTSVAALSSGQTTTLPAGTLGYEWDGDLDNGVRPAGLFDLSTATYTMTADLLLDEGANYGAGSVTHHMTTYRASSGALVFAAGTVQWSWGLDSNHDNPFFNPNNPPSLDMQQATVNLFADMSVQPATLQSGLVLATKSTDTTPPTSTITSPTAGSAVQLGFPLTITGTATDAGGGVVGGVEVSVDGGTTWHPASGRANWSYSYTPSTPGTLTIRSRSVDDSGNVETPGPGVTATVPQPPVGIDVQTSADSSSASTTVKTLSFSTASGNELLLAFVATDYLSGTNTTVTGISGAGLTWVLVARSNAQSGSSEIWRAFTVSPLTNVTVTATLSQAVVASITVVSFTGVDTSGTNGSGAIGATKTASAASGAPSATLVTTRNYSWVFGVGNDYDAAIARTPGSNQVLVHQYLTSAGDTYWVQRQSGPTPASGTSVTINDTAPTTDRFNLAICEILASISQNPWSISGTVSPASVGSGTLLTLSGSGSATSTADSSGNYTFLNLANGTYTVTPSKSGVTFNPASRQVNVNGGIVTGVNFAVPTWTISGTISGGSGATVTLSGAGTGTVTADTNGVYTFNNLVNGTYTVTPTKTGYSISPSSQSVTISNASNTSVNFTATALPTWTISGTISPASIGSGASVTLGGSASATTTADSSGNYSFANLTNGNYVVTPGKSGDVFAPASQSVPINSANATGVNFTGQAGLSLDVNVSTNGASASTTIASPLLSTTQPNELLLAFVATDYLSGANTTVSSISGAGLTWTLVVRTNVQSGTSEIWRAFAPATLSNTTVSATLSQSVVSSITILSFVGVDTSGTNGSGAIGATKSSSASTGAPSATLVTTRGGSWVFGVGNDFDNAIARTVGAGQTLIHQYPTSAGDTYWVQGESASSPVSGTSVTINDTAPTTDRYNLSIVEVLPAPTGTGGSGSWTISGTITPLAGGAGATVSLSGSASATTTSNASGAYSFAGLADGTYTVTPSNSGYSFSPQNQTVPIAGANVGNVNFTAQPLTSSSLAIDANVSKDQATASTTITTSAFSTTAGNELLLAFISTDYLSGANTTVTSVAGGGLTWTLLVRANVQTGSSEIWRASSPSVLSNVTVTATLSQSVVSSMTVMSFSGVASSGTGATGKNSAPSGAPTASLSTTGTGSMVLGVGNDFDNAIARTPGSGQNLVHQYFTSTGDTYWVQMLSNPVASSGTNASISDTAPTTDRYNLAIVEVLPGTGGGTAQPPVITMTSPAPNGTVSSKVTVAANASDQGSFLTGVQFLLDGNNLGTQVTSSPYSTVWDTTTATAGTHTLSAIAYNSAGQSTTSTSMTVTVDNSGSPTVVGSWSSPVSLPTVAVNLILLKTNRVLLYQDGSSPTVWDYVNNVFTSVPTGADLFCSGHALLSDGRVLVVGGYGGGGTNIGIANAEIFDPSNNSWTIIPSMSYSRWYPTATTLSDGRVIVMGGWQTTNHTNAGIPEIYDPSANSWTKLTNANNPFETYPFIYMLPDGRLVHVNGSEYPTVTDILNLTTQSWSTVDSNIRDGGSASMYLPNKIMKAGSASDSQNSGPSANTTFVLDMTQPSPSWTETSSMVYPRSFLNLTELPDGTVLATGGETDKNGGNISNAVYAAELWSPATQTWSTMSSMHTPREYHSTALLLPDGRVLVSGMGADFGNVPNEMSAEFYSPTYLFKGARPTITQAPAQISYGQNFFVQTPDGASISSAVLIRTGAVTHFFDQNSRFVPVTFQQTGGGLTVTAPPNATTAQPGYYMLFIVNSNGVPSVAPFVQLQ